MLEIAIFMLIELPISNIYKKKKNYFKLFYLFIFKFKYPFEIVHIHFIMQKKKSILQNNSKKTKFIRKCPKGEKRGRPKRREENEEDFEIEQNTNVDKCRESLIRYNQSIGFRNGMVFNQKEREKLRNEQAEIKKIQWDPHHEWKQNQEREKIDQIFEKRNESELRNTEKIQNLKTSFNQIANIYPRQITMEIYVILIEVAHISSSENNKEAISELAEKLFLDPEFIFLTCKFSKYYPPKQDLKNHLITLIQGLCIPVRNLANVHMPSAS